ncbi:hypothetical protein L1049_025360 [Liquidambar formosana]|uniref:F-box domain-containing protein n=1 Tax=Liquidambar formosana TaxID=63359 RepID=A0AAP0QZF4_LIQFO
MATTLRNMPNDIIINILSRLPVKSLIRFKCVCKSWHALVSDPNFIDTHLNHTRANNDGYVLSKYRDWENSGGEHKAVLHCDETFVEHTQLELPLKSFFEGPRVVGYCDGLFCIYSPKSQRYECDVYLWNPSIRKFRVLPDIDSFNGSPVAFGFVPQINDYTVVNFFYDENFRGMFSRAEGMCITYPPRVDIYSLRTNSWEEVQNVIPCQPWDRTKYSTLNGVVHWVAVSGTEENQYEFILSFDMANKIFGEIKLPEYDGSDGILLDKSAMALMGSLPLFVSLEDRQRRGVWIDIWVMKKYGAAESWSKQYSFNLELNVYYPVGFMKNDEVVLKLQSAELISYDPRSQQVKHLHVHPVRTYLSDFTYYTESLLLLNEGN